jgi:hypothetical protein
MSDNTQPGAEKVKMLKSDAIIIVKISTGFLQKLQGVLMYLSENLTEEKIKLFNEEVSQIKDHFNFSEPWMQHLYVIGLLVKEIEREGIEQGFSYEVDLDILEKLQEDETDASNTSTDLPPHQSQEQPE